MYDVITIGSWTCPSGNSVDVMFTLHHAGVVGQQNLINHISYF